MLSAAADAAAKGGDSGCADVDGEGANSEVRKSWSEARNRCENDSSAS